VGVIGIAAGTVLLPEMARLIAGGDEPGAHRAQNRAIGFTLVLSAPFFAAFLVIPDLIVAAMFQRGSFDATSARTAAMVLAAYTVGLPAVLLLRSVIASFTARGDTTTPLWASLTGIACNLVLKLVLWRPYGAAGLALATAIGAWINIGILWFLALRDGKASPDSMLLRTAAMVGLASVALALAMVLLRGPVTAFAAQMSAHYAREVALVLLGLAGLVLYGGLIILGARLFKVPLRRR